MHFVQVRHSVVVINLNLLHSSGISQSERCNRWRLRNDEGHAVPSVMKLIEKVTDEEVDGMIPETDVDDTQCSEQLVDVSVPQIADRIVEVVTALHGSESHNEPSHRLSTCRDRHTVWWRTSVKILSPPQQVANAQDAKKQSEIIKKTVQQKNPIIHEKMNQVSKQKGHSIPSQHI